MARDHRRLAAIVSLDVVGYSRLMGVDESGTLAALKAHRRELIDPKIAEHDGRIVKTTGDGLLLEFPSLVDAVRCAVEVQRGMAEAAVAMQERRSLFARVAPRRSVEGALTRHAGTKDLVADLNVHFLIRGNVTRVASGYTVEMLVVDGATERVLGTRSLTLAAGARTPRRRAQPALAAAIHYQLAQFEPSAQMARKAITELDKDSLSKPNSGAVGLTLVAAEARL